MYRLMESDVEGQHHLPGSSLNEPSLCCGICLEELVEQLRNLALCARTGVRAIAGKILSFPDQIVHLSPLHSIRP
jgi:hypothetical protein